MGRRSGERTCVVVELQREEGDPCRCLVCDPFTSKSPQKLAAVKEENPTAFRTISSPAASYDFHADRQAAIAAERVFSLARRGATIARGAIIQASVAKGFSLRELHPYAAGEEGVPIRLCKPRSRNFTHPHAHVALTSIHT